MSSHNNNGKPAAATPSEATPGLLSRTLGDLREKGWSGVLEAGQAGGAWAVGYGEIALRFGFIPLTLYLGWRALDRPPPARFMNHIFPFLITQ
eukprot:CAMPEP_0177665292 /NCGR_PEP_ID=MMETSP0447-20121125/20974_1 /TAXON_ID=0 /ORGANISM="Stygamoeba regulata, Strain BSH-02190019" /LENGTH=92 /DNA_ID=CAMNT_0019171371 /DNA_START=56 /DNA_END=334 /DNA_ORIENTATION=+